MVTSYVFAVIYSTVVTLLLIACGSSVFVWSN